MELRLGATTLELIDAEDSSEVDVHHDLVGSNRTLIRLIAGVIALGLLFVLLRPSDPVRSTASSTTTTEPRAASAAAEGEVANEPGRLTSPQTLVRPERTDIPESIALDGPAMPFTLLGQNDRGQIVTIDLATGAAAEVDRPSGQLFQPRVASDRRVAGFRVFLGESISIGADGSLRTMPVTEMDLPVVFRAADGDGFIIHESASNALWAESDDGDVTSLEPLAPGVALRAVVNGGLIVATADGVDRRFDPVTGEFGDALVGRVLAHGADRYISQSCDDGTCEIEIRSLNDDEVIAPIDLELTRRDRLAISPSGGLLAATSGADVVIFDLSSGESVGQIDGRLQPQFVWTPDDHLLFWSAPNSVMLLVDSAGDSVVLDTVLDVLDPTQPINVIMS